jgi:hypothetical protein
MWYIHGNSNLTLMDSMEANHEFQKECELESRTYHHLHNSLRATLVRMLSPTYQRKDESR